MTNFSWTTATSGNWDDTTKWLPSGFPDTGDNAFITTFGSYTVTVDDTFDPDNLTFSDASGILDIGGDHLFVDTSTTFTAGTITIEGGEFDVGVNGMATSAGATLSGWGVVDHEITGAGTVVAASNNTLELVDADNRRRDPIQYSGECHSAGRPVECDQCDVLVPRQHR